MMTNLDQFKVSGMEWLRLSLVDMVLDIDLVKTKIRCTTNLTDNKYRTYPNLPLIGRRVLGKLTLNL